MLDQDAQSKQKLQPTQERTPPPSSPEGTTAKHTIKDHPFRKTEDTQVDVVHISEVSLEHLATHNEHMERARQLEEFVRGPERSQDHNRERHR